MAEDEPRAQAEFGALFRRDVEAFLTREVVDACVVPERRELPPVEGTTYHAFIDPSGGSADSMTMSIGHQEKREGANWVVLDLIREVKPPFQPSQVVDDFAAELKRYRLRTATADRYAAEWTVDAFRKVEIQLKAADKTKSELYRELLAPLNSGTVELLDHPKLIAQLVGLERRVARGGRESIDHVPGAHDDVANAVAGVIHSAAHRRAGWGDVMDLFGKGGYYDRPSVDDDESARDSARARHFFPQTFS